MTRLALAMIVRNEAAQLPAFLAHHQGLFDELVVVDTGSADNTVPLLRAAGAVVVESPWQEDFAAARNVGLAGVQADWVLLLDADERISQRDFGSVRAALTEERDRVYLQETWNYCSGTAHLEWQPVSGRYPAEEVGQTGLFVARRVGLFPCREDLRFSGRVHESVLPAAAAAGIPIRPLGVPVHHYGYVGDEAHNSDRQARYRRLVELKFADDPGDPASQLELASVRLEDGDTTAALAQLEILARGPAGLRPVVRGLVLYGRLQREMGNVERARNLLSEAIRQDPDFVFGWLERIRVEAGIDDWEGAEAILEEAEARFGPGEPQLLREALRIQVNRHRLSEALATAETLVSFCPQWQEIRDLQQRLLRMQDKSGKV